MRCLFAFTIAGLIVCAASTRAQTLPRYDVAAYCATAYMNYSGSKETCMQLEGLMYDAVQARWQRYPGQLKQDCVNRADPAGRPPELWQSVLLSSWTRAVKIR